MAGLLLKFSAASALPYADTSAVVVNLAPYFVSDRLQRGPIELAWSRARAGRHWFQLVEPQRWLVVEGNPDRLPSAGESLTTWLQGRWGSFRGIEVLWENETRPALITAFVDPWASRPLYYFSGDSLIIADKVATIAANQTNPEVDWAALSEAMLCGSVYSGGVSLKNTTALRTGEEARFLGLTYRDSHRHSIPSNSEISEGIVRSNPVGALRQALARSVADTWQDLDTYLFLTGGLDSRFLLALGGADRRAIHINIYPQETKYARAIAAAADNCHLLEFDLSPGSFLRVMERAYLLTAAMFDSRFAWQLGFGAAWSKSGVSATLNGYLFDTLLKGYFFVPYQKYPYPYSPLFSLMGPLAHSMRGRHGRFSGYAPDVILTLLRPDAQELGKQQMRRLPDIFPQVVVDGVDVSFERIVLSNISRQVHYPLLLGWMEETEAYTPAFHSALWSWYKASSVADRKDGRALRSALASLQHPVCAIPDASTGLAIDIIPTPPRSERLGFRNYFLFSKLRDTLRRGRPMDSEPRFANVGRYIQTQEAQKLIREWIDRTQKHLIFDSDGLESAWKTFQQGDDRFGESLLVMMGVRQWEEWVKHPTIQPEP